MPPTYDRSLRRDQIPSATASRFQARSTGCSTGGSSLWTMTSESCSQQTSLATCNVSSTRAEKSSCRTIKRFARIDRSCNSTGSKCSRANVARHLTLGRRALKRRTLRWSGQPLWLHNSPALQRRNSAYVSARETARRCSLLWAKCWSERGDSNSRPLAPEATGSRDRQNSKKSNLLGDQASILFIGRHRSNLNTT